MWPWFEASGWFMTSYTSPETAIVTLDAEDAPIGDQMLGRLTAAYARCRSHRRLDAAHRRGHGLSGDAQGPRTEARGKCLAAPVSFRKRLFDAMPDEALRLDGDYADMATDQAFMLPIIEMAEHPVPIAEPLYLHEPSGKEEGLGPRDAGSEHRTKHGRAARRTGNRARQAREVVTLLMTGRANCGRSPLVQGGNERATPRARADAGEGRGPAAVRSGG